MSEAAVQGGYLDLSWHVCVEVDTVAVRVLKAGIALAPEGIPGRHVTASTIRQGHAGQAVNVADDWVPEHKSGAGHRPRLASSWRRSSRCSSQHRA
jgi:hypothetical protein